MIFLSPIHVAVAIALVSTQLQVRAKDSESVFAPAINPAMSGQALTGKPETQQTPKLPAESPEPVAAKPPWGRIVMVGASASAGFTASEPLGGPTTPQYDLGRYLDAALLVPHEPIRNLANSLFFIQPEVTGRSQIDQALKVKPTLVIGGDFLFWYCYGQGSTDEERLKRFETGLKVLEAVQCPLVVGDLPDASAAINGMLRKEQVPSARALTMANGRLREWAAARQNVSVLPLAEFMRAATADKGLVVHGYALSEGRTRGLLQSDLLHPSHSGCAIMALSILDNFQGKHPAISADEVCWDPVTISRQALRSAVKRSAK